MNILIDELPTSVMIDDVEYVIRTDFRISIMYELLMLDEDIPKSQKLRNALNLYFPVIPHNIDRAIECILWFYQCGAKEQSVSEDFEEDSEENSEEDSEEDYLLNEEKYDSQNIYSYEYDAGYIYAAFMQQYGIDLTEKINFHWWKFRALFLALNDSCEFVKIMGYRSIKTSSKMSNEQRLFYSKMKNIHALPVPNAKKEHIDKLTYALLNGGDLTGVI